MHTLNLKIYAFLCMAIIVLAVALFSRCDRPHPSLPLKVKEDVEFKDLPPAPPIIIRDSIKIKVKIYVPVHDSSELKEVIAERDSLSKVLTAQNVRVSFSTDTVHPVTHDTMRIECDELNHHINYSINYAPRQEKIVTRTETYLTELTFWDKIKYSLFGAAFIEGLHLIFGK